MFRFAQYDKAIFRAGDPLFNPEPLQNELDAAAITQKPK
jgi:hypothetical protein